MDTQENINNISKCYICDKFFFYSVIICNNVCNTIQCEYCGKEFYFDINGKKYSGHNPEHK